jgi:hypothetical protein
VGKRSITSALTWEGSAMRGGTQARLRGWRPVLLMATLVTGIVGSVGGVAANDPVQQRSLYEHTLREYGQAPPMTSLDVLRMLHEHTLRENAPEPGMSSADRLRLLHEHTLREYGY